MYNPVFDVACVPIVVIRKKTIKYPINKSVEFKKGEFLCIE